MTTRGCANGSIGRCCKSCECFVGTGTGISSQGLGHDGRRRRDNVRVSTGTRVGPEKNDVIVARGAAAAATDGVEAADSFGPLCGGAAVAYMLVAIPVRVDCEL